MTDLFISYSRKDVLFARQLTASLEARGADVWFDQTDIHAGVKWSSAIQQGLREAQAMILIISPDAMASSNVEDEWQYFLDKKKPIIPVLLHPADIHFQLNRIQYIDFAAQTYEAAFEQLIAELALNGVALMPSLSKAVTPPPRPAISNALPEDMGGGDTRSRILQIVIAVVIVIAAVLLRELYVASVPDPRIATQTAADQTAIAARSTQFAPATQVTLTLTPEATPEVTLTADERVLQAAFAITAAFEDGETTNYTVDQWNAIYATYPELQQIELPLGQAMLFDIAIQYGLHSRYFSDLIYELQESGTPEDDALRYIAYVRYEDLAISAERVGIPDLTPREDFWLERMGEDDWQLQGDEDGDIEVNGELIHIGG